MGRTSSNRLLGYLGATLATLLVLGGLALWAMGDIERRAREVAREAAPAVSAYGRADAGVHAYRELQFELLAREDTGARVAIERRLRATEEDVAEGFADAIAVSPDGDAEAAQATWRGYLTASAPVEGFVADGRADAAVAVLTGAAQTRFERTTGLLDAGRTAAVEEGIAAADAASRRYEALRWSFVGVLVAAVLGLGGVGIWQFLVQPWRRSMAVERFHGQVQRALERADEEEDALDVVRRGVARAAPRARGELLLADSSSAHLERAVVAGTDPAGAGCGVTSPRECPAVRSGHRVAFPDSEALDACPKLRDRPYGRCSAVCVPVSVLGSTVGVLHVTDEVGRPPSGAERVQLEGVAAQVGSKLGLIRATKKHELQASTDSLTGLPNRRSLQEAAREVVAGGGPYAVAMLDLDRFKQLNDTYGHDAGDRALAVFAEALRSATRGEDLPARWGGEEFVVVLPGCSAVSAAPIVQRVRARLGEAVEASGGPRFTTSAGIADSSTPGGFDEVLARADMALLAAKEAGRDRVEIAMPMSTSRVVSTISSSSGASEPS